MINFSKEIIFQTARSGGKGGQNVNKVETAVIAFLDISKSVLLSIEQRKLVHEKLSNRINSLGILQVKSQTHRNQLSNKADAVEKINYLIHNAILKKKARIATKATKSSKENRIFTKKNMGMLKQGRQKIRIIE